MNPRDLHINSARDGVESSGHLDQGANPMAVPSSVPDLGDIAERVDNGQRLALVEHTPDLDAVQRMRIEEFGTTRPELALERLEDSRLELREAMKVVDTTEDRDLHQAIAMHLDRLDDLMAVVRERIS